MFTPAAASFATSARLCGSSAKARTEAGNDRADVGNGLQRFDWRVEQRVHVPQIARHRRGGLLADVPDAQCVNQPGQIVFVAARDLLVRRCGRPFRACGGPPDPSGAPVARPRALRAGTLPGGTDRRNPGPIPARSADRPVIRQALRYSWPSCDAKCSRLRCANVRDTTSSRSARRLPLRPGDSSLPQTLQVAGITHGTESSGLRFRIGATTRGITSPAFSMTTVSPSRMSLRARSSALCSVAIEIVEPARNTGSRTAYGVFAPVRPTLTSIFSSFV